MYLTTAFEQQKSEKLVVPLKPSLTLILKSQQKQRPENTCACFEEFKRRPTLIMFETKALNKYRPTPIVKLPTKSSQETSQDGVYWKGLQV